MQFIGSLLTSFLLLNRDIINQKDNQEMLIELHNGSIFQVVGTDNIDSVVGTNPVGCVFSEYSLQDPRAWDYISPILAENGGWALFNCTPRGENHAYDLLQIAEDDEQWWTQILTVDDTKAIAPSTLAGERRQILQRYGDDAFYQQEYYCSFSAPLQGSYYANQLMLAESEGRLSKVPFDPVADVHTAWDLGMSDATAIWFFQVANKEIHLIDYFEASGEGLQFYVDELKERMKTEGYTYGTHYFPHDTNVRELGPNKTRREQLIEMGLPRRRIKIVQRTSSVHDAIQKVRSVLGDCWFDKEKCKRGISALKNYHKEWDEKREIYKSTPVHDWSSHSADAFRQLALGWKDRQEEQIEYVPVELDPYA